MEALFVHFTDVSEWRNWLIQHAGEFSEVWLIFHKKETGINELSYDDALKEALCAGWIDSIIKKLDERRYARKFTPRSNFTNWSEKNKKLIEDLYQNGVLDPNRAGVDKFIKQGKFHWPKDSINKPDMTNLKAPEFFLQVLSENEPALSNFNNLSKNHKREYILWITMAKRPDTIQRRMDESVRLLKENQKLGLR